LVNVLAVNNYPTTERFEKLRRCLEDGGARVTAAAWSDSAATRFAGFDGVALSGSPYMLSQERAQRRFRAEADAVRDATVPVLGVCFGHQLMALAFGGQVVRESENVLKFVKTVPLAVDPLFAGLSSGAMLLESRHEVVRSVPEGFRLLAKSETSSIAAMRHARRPLYGVQSHPERYTSENPAGKRLVANFVGLLR
jgi:GMP synthase (glutamine-hydrolysing)